MRVMLAVALLLAACRGDERDAAAAVVKETFEAVRRNELVVIKVRLDEREMPSANDLKVRDTIEERLVQERIGTITARDAGVGFYSLAVEVESTADAVPRVRAILRELGVLEQTSVEIRGAG